MSSEQTQSKNELVEEKIAQYLSKNPDFFARHKNLLSDLNIQHQVYGSISLVEKQILALREREAKLTNQLQGLIETGQQNSDLLGKSSTLAISLIKSANAQSVIDNLQQGLLGLFALDNCQVWLNNDNGTLNHVNYGDLEIIQQLTEQVFLNKEPMCGRVTDSIAQLFGGDHELESYALIPLGDGAHIGLVMLGSKDVNLFTADMGTLFLRLIGDIVESCLEVHDS